MSRISSPARNGRERSTAVAAAVAFGTSATPSGSAPTNAARWLRACWMRSSSPRVKKAIGFASISSRSRCWARWTGRGTAPYEPWLRCVVCRSSVKSARRRAHSTATPPTMVTAARYRLDGVVYRCDGLLDDQRSDEQGTWSLMDEGSRAEEAQVP